MRKAYLMIVAILMSVSLHAVTEPISDSFMIQAGYEEACSVVVHEIAAQSASYIGGMPFNIEEDIVQHHADDVGRRIATIDIISNTRFRMTVTSDGPMKHIENDGVTRTVTSTPLDYILTFQFLVGYYESGNINENATTTVRYRSAGGDTAWTIGASPDPDTFLGTVDGAIYFMFDDAASKFISDDNTTDEMLPPGNYDSTVTITVEAVE